MKKKITAVTLGASACMAFAFAASAELNTTITFENDPAGPVPDGFVSADSPLVSFSNNFGLGLAIGDYGVASDGQGIAVGDNDSSGLLMNFSTLMNALSLDFGNDDPNLTLDGDYALLTIYLDGFEVDHSIVLLNRNTAMDQSISISGTEFNSAVIEFYSGGDGITEVVDNIRFTAVPAPGIAGMLGAAGACGLFGRSRRRTGR